MASYTQQSKLSSNNNFESTTFFFIDLIDLTTFKNEVANIEKAGITITNISISHRGGTNRHDCVVVCAGKILQS
jgi:hypothetical protein